MLLKCHKVLGLQELKVEVKFIDNCFEVITFLEYLRGGQRGYMPALVYFLYVMLTSAHFQEVSSRRGGRRTTKHTS